MKVSDHGIPSVSILQDALAEANLNHMFERHMTAYRIAQLTVETNL